MLMGRKDQIKQTSEKQIWMILQTAMKKVFVYHTTQHYLGAFSCGHLTLTMLNPDISWFKTV